MEGCRGGWGWGKGEAQVDDAQALAPESHGELVAISGLSHPIGTALGKGIIARIRTVALRGCADGEKSGPQILEVFL